MESDGSNNRNDMEEYFSGKQLIGDDYGVEQLKKWYKEEEDAYYDLFIEGECQPFRNNDFLHSMYGFRYLKSDRRIFDEALGFGSGDGRELWPIIERIQHLTIIESSEKYFTESDKYQYVKASISGNLPFPSNRFDLIVSFATLHHIANVSTVMSEFFRCLKPGGVCLIKEPITSMGDWRLPRKGCTKNERGIPINIFDDIIAKQGFKVLKRHFHEMPLVSKLWTKFHIQVFNNPAAMYLDRLLSKVFSFNIKYHRRTLLEKLMPNYVFVVLTKP
jgi:SAM-dependent methyltransferase